MHSFIIDDALHSNMHTNVCNILVFVCCCLIYVFDKLAFGVVALWYVVNEG